MYCIKLVKINVVKSIKTHVSFYCTWVRFILSKHCLQNNNSMVMVGFQGVGLYIQFAKQSPTAMNTCHYSNPYVYIVRNINLANIYHTQSHKLIRISHFLQVLSTDMRSAIPKRRRSDNCNQISCRPHIFQYKKVYISFFGKRY